MKLIFDEAFTIGKTARKAVKQKDYLPEGKFPVIDQGEDFISGYSDDESQVLDFTKPVIIFGDHTRRLKYVKFPFIPGADGTKILVPSDSMDSKFAFYQLQSKELRDRGYARHFSELRKEEFWVPPIDEQYKIVKLLEEHLSRLDKALVDVKLANVKAAQFRRSLLHSIFNGQVEVFGNKNEWDKFILSDLVQNFDNKRIPVNSKERSNREGTVPYYGATGQVGTIDVPIFNEDLLLLGEDGVQFFDPSKPKAYLISGPSWVNNHAHVLKVKDSIANQKLIMHYLNQFNYVGYANGTTRLKLTQSAMNLIPISLPNRLIQDKMIEYIEKQLSIIDASVIASDYAADQSLSLRRSLLQSAFKGNLTNEVAVV